MLSFWPTFPFFLQEKLSLILIETLLKSVPNYSISRQSIIALGLHQMETFSALLANCAGNSPVTGEFNAQRPVTRSIDVLLDLRLIKWLSKQSWSWWFETPSRPLWRHCNGYRWRPCTNQRTGPRLGCWWPIYHRIYTSLTPGSLK